MSKCNFENLPTDAMDTFSNISVAASFVPGLIQNLHFVFHQFFSKLVSKFKIMSLQRRTEAKYPLQALADLPNTYGKWK